MKKKYILIKNPIVKNTIAITLACTMAVSLFSYIKNKKDNKMIKLINENGEDLVVITLIDKASDYVIGNEMYGYIDEDFNFNSVTKDYSVNLNFEGNTNCDFYYTKYLNCLSEKEKKEATEIPFSDISEFEKKAYIIIPYGEPKLTDETKVINMDKLDYGYFKDSEEKEKVMVKQN